HKEAQQHLDRARRIFISLKDSGSVAQVDDTRARAFLAQGRNAEAERVVRASVSILENGDEYALLAEALTTHGTALARLGRYEEARRTLRCASEAAARAGDIEGAGRAELTLIEELDTHLNAEKMRAIYESADQLLANSRSPETLARLRRCARRVLAAERDRVKGFSAPNFIYAAGQTAALLRESHRIATTNQTVLITGETGTGKELLARMIHEWSGRAGEFVVINCAALTDTLIEAQLFGHVKGSSTDVAEDRPGALRADGGTLFLDEVADLSDHNQVKLLRLIEYGEIHPVGAPVPERMDVRIIAATNHNLREEMTEGRFRADLFYRLQAFHLEIPPLRERPEDISLIARQFIKEAKEQQEKHVMFTDEALETMRRLPLRGNVRELRSLIERAVVEADDGDLVTPEAIETVALRQTRRTGFANPWAVCSLEEEVLRFEADLIKRALEMAKGSITHAARLLGITHQGLAFILNGRHKNLLAARIPAKRRKRSVIGTSRRKGS
ncbi:MAG TPA: sigma 54-interacting transcriptional regulator, partial [Pyrinomonadaceae bacterium]|nr:sigma 54-interacting transcriptional regulator [Pyrinomonadaceae bacterium]